MKTCFRCSPISFVRSLVRVLPLVLVVVAFAITASADAPHPWQGSRTIDGDPSDWNLTKDFFDYMYRAGNPTKPVDSFAYMRYDCTTNILYVLVLRNDPVFLFHNDPDTTDVTAWIAIDDISNKVINEHSGNDGTPPDYEWIGLGFDGDPTHAGGYEAAIFLLPGTYEIIVHAQIVDAAGQGTSAFAGFPLNGVALELGCTVPVEQTTWGKIKLLYR
jgi:hypothetical protein